MSDVVLRRVTNEISLTSGSRQITLQASAPRTLAIARISVGTSGARRFDTEAELLASVMVDGSIAYALDTDKFYFHIDGEWGVAGGVTVYATDAELQADDPDDGTIGYAEDTDKFWFRAGGAWTIASGVTVYDTALELLADSPDDGSIGYASNTDVFYFRANGAWDIAPTKTYVDAGDATEAAARAAADSAEAAARAAADTSEATARAAADTAETAARIAADSAEASTRAAADSSEASTRASADTAESAARVAADTAESAARIAADALKADKATTFTAGAGLTGGGDLSNNRTLTVGANADGSIVVNADDVQVGVLASDAQHGVRGGGTQHAVAVAGVAAGFISAANQSKLDGIAAGATVGLGVSRPLGVTIDGGVASDGSTRLAIQAGAVGYARANCTGTITGWVIVADVSGSMVVDVWKDTYGNFPPTVFDTIAGSEKPTLSNALRNTDTNLTTWTTVTATEGEWFGFKVDSASTVTWASVILLITPTA